MCTFVSSDTHSLVCDVCNHPNPLLSWACSACTFQNSDKNLEACTSCNSPRQPVIKPQSDKDERKACAFKLQARAQALRSEGQCEVAAKLLVEASFLGSSSACADLADMLIDGRKGLNDDGVIASLASKFLNLGLQFSCHHCQGVASRCHMSSKTLRFPKEFAECVDNAVDVESLAQKSAAKGSRYGQFMLGRLLLETNPASAEELFRLSADQNYEEAQTMMGLICERNQDAQGALRWFKLAAAQGHGGAL